MFRWNKWKRKNGKEMMQYLQMIEMEMKNILYLKKEGLFLMIIC